MLKVALIITGLGKGGAERVVLDLASDLIRSGAEVKVVCLAALPSTIPYEHDERIDFVSLGVEKRSLASMFCGLLKVARLSANFRCQIIHAHMFHALLFAILWKAACPSVKIVFTSHSSYVSRWRTYVLRCLKGLRACDVLFSTNQHPRLNAKRVAVISNGTSLSFERRPRQEPRTSTPWIVISVGRLSAAKAPVRLAKHFARLRRRDVELWFVGDGDLKRDLEEVIAEEGIADRVRLLGARNDVGELLEQAHIFAMGSKWEGMPMALLEAGARGIPVLSTPVGSVPDILSGECGFLSDIERFPESICRILENYDDALWRGKRLQKKIFQSYSTEKMTSKHLELYRGLLAISASGFRKEG